MSAEGGERQRARSRSLLSDSLIASLKPAPPPRIPENMNSTYASKPTSQRDGTIEHANVVSSEPKNPLGKPIHPALVHWPFAFLSLAVGLDVLHAVSGYLPNFITSNLLLTTDATRASYYLLSLGLLTAIPAVTTGVGEAIKAIKKQGLNEKDNGPIKAKFKATIAHAVSMDIVLALAAYIWYCRRSAAANTLAGKMGVGSLSTGEAAYAPATWMVVVEAIFGVLLAFSANIGGTLTYNFGFGMAIGGANKKSA